MRRALFVALAAGAVSHSAAAQDTAFVRALREQSAQFEIVGGRLQGSGADAIGKVAREHDFLLVGEDHGIREVPQFVSALWRTARPHGYSHFAVEIGPITGRRLETMVRSPNGLQSVNNFLGKYTAFTLPFFFWREESEMLESVVKSLPSSRDVVWGIDQEFMVAPTYLLERLAQIAPNAAARATAQKAAASAAHGDTDLIARGNPGRLWMLSTTDAEFEALRSAFRPARGSEADNIIRELGVSRDIYRKFNSGAGYESNQQRDDLMKKNFQRYYQAAKARGEARPKAIVKLGANHVFRGPSITNTYEIGSFIPELAVMNDVKSFGILVITGPGTWNAYRPFGSTEADKTQRYDVLTSAEYAVFDLKSVFMAAGTKGWTFIDLRPIRAKAGRGTLRKLDATAIRLLNSFDGVVMAPESHASVMIR